jgi:hypothetical protein
MPVWILPKAYLHTPYSSITSTSIACLRAAFCRGRDLLRFPINVCYRHCPERNQVDAGNELAKKRRQEFPVPTKEVSHHGPDTEIEYVSRGRIGSFDE